MPANCGANKRSLAFKSLRVAYKDTYRIFRYIPRNVSVRPRQVSILSFVALIRNHLYAFCSTMRILMYCFNPSLELSDAFYKPPFFLH